MPDGRQTTAPANFARKGGAATIAEYARQIAQLRGGGRAGEHAYRASLQHLLRGILPDAQAINEGERGPGGNPDFRVEWNYGALLGHIETKNIGADLDGVESSPQMLRYLREFQNLVLTDYLEFRHYVRGSRRDVVRLSAVGEDGKILPPTSEAKDALAQFLRAFAERGRDGAGESPSAELLAETLANKTRELKKRTKTALDAGNEDLASLHRAFRKGLILDLSADDFADVFAQTAAYGLFAARLAAESRGRAREFSRQMAGELLPQTTPLLRKFFDQFVRGELPPAAAEAADEIAAYLRDVNMENVIRGFRKNGGREDPFLYFYETFLKKYDPAERKLRGVYYTPDAATDFVARAADDCLREFFHMPDGLADVEKTNGGFHRVQILDPAAGTGAFLAKIMSVIKKRAAKYGRWDDYVVEHLAPRLHGFEYMMSAYAMCHLKFAVELGRDTLHKLAAAGQRVGVYLTDTLDYGERDHGAIGLGWLEREAKDADRVKNRAPVMVVVGNPPYSVSSQNKGERISELLRDYKKDLREKKLNLDDDYIKFIRNAEDMIRRTGRGVFSFVCNNSFYDGVTHRRMREHLLDTFDRIYILNLHGDARKRERAADGGGDKNIFDIMQGVGVFVMIKNGEAKNGRARVFYQDCYGAREAKYDFMLRESIKTVRWTELSPVAPYCFFTPKDFSQIDAYRPGVRLTDLFRVFGSGVKTDRNSLFVDFDEGGAAAKVRTLLSGGYGDDFALAHNVRDSSGYPMRRRIGGATFSARHVAPITFRPFDSRFVYYDPKLISRPNDKVTRHLLGGDNIALLAPRTMPANQDFDRALLTRQIADINSASGQTYVFPLYLYEKMQGGIERRANINADAAARLAAAAKMKYGEDEEMNPAAILDYAYAVLHNPHYRARFAEFLKFKFARISLPKGKAHFRKTAAVGGALRRLHLLEDASLDDGETRYVGGGGDVVQKARATLRGGKLRIAINEEAAFENAPAAAWDFSLGGCKPAQKWLKDRRGRKLSYDDQRRYRRILAALARTKQIADEMDDV